jgi:hypothetical protein
MAGTRKSAKRASGKKRAAKSASAQKRAKKASGTTKKTTRVRSGRGPLKRVRSAGKKTWEALKSTTAHVVEGVKGTFGGEQSENGR